MITTEKCAIPEDILETLMEISLSKILTQEIVDFFVILLCIISIN